MQLDFSDHLTGDDTATKIKKNLYRNISIFASTGHYQLYNDLMKQWYYCSSKKKDVQRLQNIVDEALRKLNQTNN